MPKHKKFPTIKKKLSNFLADESGKITKEDVLKLSLGAMMVSGLTVDVEAVHSNSGTHANGGSQVGNYTTVGNRGLRGGVWYDPGSGYCSVSKNVNGHFNNSSIPGTLRGGGITGVNVTNHSNHYNSGSGGGGGWC